MAVVRHSLASCLDYFEHTSGDISATVEFKNGNEKSFIGPFDHVRSKLEELNGTVNEEDVLGVRTFRDGSTPRGNQDPNPTVGERTSHPR